VLEGFVNLYKEIGMTSHDAVAIARRVIGSRRVGHMGTLDPAAEGVLPLAIGRATRLISFVEGTTKEYKAELVLGIATDTWDLTGQVLVTANAAHIAREHVAEVLPQFIGRIAQEPPMFSAIKIAGRKLYEFARQGIEVARESRAVEIHALEIEGWREEGIRRVAVLKISCSKGTYVRSLCRDLGKALGIAACMGRLLRIASGPFRVEGSVSLRELERDTVRHVMAIDSFLLAFPKVVIAPNEAARFVFGQRVRLAHLPEGEFAVFCGTRCLGLGANEQGVLLPTRVLSEEENSGVKND